MRLSWNEIRARTAEFAREWNDAHYERGQTQTFYNEFFEVFGVKRRKVASFEEPVKLLGGKRGFIDPFWRGTLLVEQKSAGRKLEPAKQQALDYFPGLKDYELPRYLLLSDFQTFELYDLDEGRSIAFELRDLPKTSNSLASFSVFRNERSEIKSRSTLKPHTLWALCTTPLSEADMLVTT
jgi:hypothetical protein